jgi:hypothetical protein
MDQYQVIALSTRQGLLNLNKSFNKMYGFEDYIKNSSHMSYGVDDFYFTGNYSQQRLITRYHHGYSMSSFLKKADSGRSIGDVDGQRFTYISGPSNSDVTVVKTTTTTLDLWDHDPVKVKTFGNSKQINADTFNLEAGMSISGGLSTFELVPPANKNDQIVDSNGVELLPRIRKIYSTFPQTAKYVTLGLSRHQPTLPTDMTVLFAFFETSYMVYQLPDTKPLNPSPIDLGTRIMAEPSPVVTMYANPSSKTPGYLTCFIRKDYGSSEKKLKCILSDGTQTGFYDWQDDGVTRDWTDMQIENGMTSTEFYLIGSGGKDVEVLYLFVDNFNQVITIKKTDKLTKCQSPASITANFSNIYVYCMQYADSKFQIHGYNYQRFQFKRKDLDSIVISHDYYNYGWIYDMKVHALDENHFVVSANTEG